MKNTFNAYKTLVLIESNAELQREFLKYGFRFNENTLILASNAGISSKAIQALKHIFNKQVLKDETLTTQYNAIEALKTQNHFYYVILETNGEREYHHKGLISLDEDVDPDKWLDEHTRGFYNDFSEEDGVYWFDGEVICEPFKITKLTFEEYETLKRFLL